MAIPNRILVLHNSYREAGGEDQVFQQEVDLLRDRGHTVFTYTDSNVDLDESRPLAAGLEAAWSRRTASALERLLRDARPDVAHFHNTFSRISPSAYYACQRAGVPVVQTLHNYRMGCLNAFCSRDGRPCDACVPAAIPWRGIVHKCYRDSAAASLAMAGIGVLHKSIGTYARQVDAYISTSHFAREIHLRSGVPAARSFVKPNFTRAHGGGGAGRKRVALFAGRICRDKGIHLLLDAWRRADLRDMTLQVAGDGPDLAALRGQAPPGVEFLGGIPHERIPQLMTESMFLAHPSLLYENCGLAILEAFGAGLPCVASGHGSFAELVADSTTGLLFEPGNAADLAAKLRWMAEHPAEVRQMGAAARERHRASFTAEANYAMLLDIYSRVCRS
jgi:glycosyltransferase involved in cell wall biosynthesis